MFVSVLSGSTLGDITKGALREYYPLSVALFYSRTVFCPSPGISIFFIFFIVSLMYKPLIRKKKKKKKNRILQDRLVFHALYKQRVIQSRQLFSIISFRLPGSLSR